MNSLSFTATASCASRLLVGHVGVAVAETCVGVDVAAMVAVLRSLVGVTVCVAVSDWVGGAVDVVSVLGGHGHALP